MMQVEYKLKLGNDEFTLKAEVKDEKDFFQKMSFYSNLPKTAPGGSTDLKLVFRTTKKGHKYYSLVSEKEKLEFRFGQNLEVNGGGLFPKSWEALYQGGDDSDDSSAPGQLAMPGVQVPSPQYAAPAQMPSPAYPGMVAPSVGPTAAAPVAPQPAAPAPQAAPAVAPQTAAMANDVLARFGIKK